MATPLYFLVGIRPHQFAPNGKLCRSLIDSRGLPFEDLTDAGQLSICEIPGSGPGGKSGVIVCALPVSGIVPKRIGYHPREQDWHQIDDGLWIGLDKIEPPTPEELQRRRMHRGHVLTLGDGQAWEIPVVRRPLDGSTDLPCGYQLSGGRWLESIKPQFKPLWEEAGEVHRDCRELGFDRLLGYALNVLAINYRVGSNEQNLLGLIDSTNWVEILVLSFDQPLIDEVQKKRPDTASEPLSSSPGTQADSPDTAPA